MISRNRWTIKWSDLPTFLLACICICCLSLKVQRTIGLTAILALWMLYCFLEGYDLLHIKLQESLTLLLIVGYLAICFLYRYIGLSDEGTGITTTILFFIPYISILPIYHKLDRKQCIFILAVSIVTAFVTMWQNYLLWRRFGFVPMHMFLEGYTEVVNTQYVSALMLLSGITFSAFLRERRKLLRYLYLGIALVCFLFNAVVTQRAITILLSFVMIPFLIMVNSKRGVGRILRFLALSSVLVFGLLGYRVILTGIANLLGSERLADRIFSIIRLFDQSSAAMEESNSLTVRLQLMGLSIQTFFASVPNFLIGVGDKADYLLVGGHGQFFDEFARYGVFGGLLSNGITVSTLYTIMKYVSLPRESVLFKQMLVIFLFFIIRGFVGTLYAPSIGATMFIILPLLFRLVYEMNEDDQIEVQSL